MSGKYGKQVLTVTNKIQIQKLYRCITSVRVSGQQLFKSEIYANLHQNLQKKDAATKHNYMKHHQRHESTNNIANIQFL